MIVLLSPSKTLDIDTKLEVDNPSTPEFNQEAQALIDTLRKKSSHEIKELMNISDELTQLNVSRYKNFKKRHTEQNSNVAIKAFQGDVYVGLDVEQFDAEDIAFANEHVRILSGLYGVLRPLDRMQPYRLEMGTRLKTDSGDTLYDFWGDKLTEAINSALYGMKNKFIVNLASNEYWKAVKKKGLKAPVIDIDFREERDGTLKFISFNAKKARGTMTRYIVKQRIDTVEALKGFDLDGYRFVEEKSSEKKLLFIK